MELSSPITIYWDLPAAADEERVRSLCDDIIACRPLMLQIRQVGGSLSAATAAILDRVRNAALKVTLTVAPSVVPQVAEGAFRVDELLAAVDSASTLRDARITKGVSLPVIGVSFRVNRTNYEELPELLLFCRENGISRIVFPMERLREGAVPFYLSRTEQESIGSRLRAAGGTDGLTMTIHDPFLWRAFYPDIPFPQGGCQAANTMIAIAPDGDVYPCPTLPVSIGNVLRNRLKEIIASPEKRDLRRRITAAPAACGGCDELPVCRGGCRGRGFVVAGSMEGADPACR